jgi:hypothetical protein
LCTKRKNKKEPIWKVPRTRWDRHSLAAGVSTDNVDTYPTEQEQLWCKCALCGRLSIHMEGAPPCEKQQLGTFFSGRGRGTKQKLFAHEMNTQKTSNAAA